MDPTDFILWGIASVFLLAPVLLTQGSLQRFLLTSAIAITVWIVYFPYLALIVFGEIRSLNATTHTVRTALMFIAASSCLFFFVWRFFRSSSRSAPNDASHPPHWNRRSVETFIRITLALGVMGWLLRFIALPQGFSTHSMSRVDFVQERSSHLWAIGIFLSHLTLVAMCSAVVARQRRWSMVSFALNLVMAGAFFLFARSRTPVIAVLISLMLLVLREMRGSRRLVLVLATSVVLVGGVPLLQVSRGYISQGIDSFVSSAGERQMSDVLNYMITTGDLAYTEFFFLALEHFPRSHDYLYGSSFYGVLMFFIPRAILPFKPRDTQHIFCEVVNPQMAAVGGTIPPSIFGDAYINFGHAGVAFFALLAAATFLVDRYLFTLRRRWHIELGIPLVATTAPHFARGGFHNAAVSCLIVATLCFMVQRFAHRTGGA